MTLGSSPIYYSTTTNEKSFTFSTMPPLFYSSWRSQPPFFHWLPSVLLPWNNSMVRIDLILLKYEKNCRRGRIKKVYQEFSAKYSDYIKIQLSLATQYSAITLTKFANRYPTIFYFHQNDIYLLWRKKIISFLVLFFSIDKDKGKLFIQHLASVFTPHDINSKIALIQNYQSM